MTAYTKLAALFAGAFLLLAQSTDAAQAGHRQTDREARKARIAQYWDHQRARNHDRQRYGDQAYWHGRSYGKRGRLYYQQHGNFRRHKAYGYRARQHYYNGDGEYWSRRDWRRRAERRYGDGDYRQHWRYGDGDFRQHRRRDGQRAGNFFFDGHRDGTRQRNFDRFHDGVRDRDRRFDGEHRVRRHRHSNDEEHVHRRRNSDDD